MPKKAAPVNPITTVFFLRKLPGPCSEAFVLLPYPHNALWQSALDNMHLCTVRVAAAHAINNHSLKMVCINIYCSHAE